MLQKLMKHFLNTLWLDFIERFKHIIIRKIKNLIVFGHLIKNIREKLLFNYSGFVLTSIHIRIFIVLLYYFTF